MSDLDKKLILGIIKNVPRLHRDPHSQKQLLSALTAGINNDHNSLLDEFMKNGDSDRLRRESKEFFKAERLKTRTEKDYLMHLAEKPVMIEL